MMDICEELVKANSENKDGTIHGYLDIRPNIKAILDKLRENTVVHKEDEWAGQIEQNWQYIEGNESLKTFVGYGGSKTAIVCGASPALKKNVEALRDIEGEYRDHFILIAVNSVAKFLLDNNIKPDFIIAVDCDEEVWTRDISQYNREDLTLMVSPFVWPEIMKNWKGRLLVLPMGCKEDAVQARTLEALGAAATIPGVGNAFNQAIYIAWWVFHCKNYVMVGSELSWPKDGDYYVDGKHSNDGDINQIPQIPATDIFGNECVTTAGHWVFKTWLEDLASKAPGVFINATEGGILGVTKDDGFLPWIKQMRLKGAIGLIKSICENTKDWHFMELMKYNLAWQKGYKCQGIPNETVIRSIYPRTILDVGCGEGATVKELVEKGYDAYGIEQATLPASKWNGLAERCILGFADNIPAEDNYFDLAIADILEHNPLEYVGDIIKEIARVSKKQMFNVEYGEAQWLIDGRIQPHTIMREREWWKKEFRRCGLSIIATSGYRTIVTEKKSIIYLPGRRF